jgi:2-methylcitrate dehydratase PrpD
LAQLARDLAAYAVGLAGPDIPPDLVCTVERAVVDTIGVALSGYDERCARAARDVIRTDTTLPASIWGHGAQRASAADAAWANAMAGHALDFDDYIESCFSHPSVVLLPALLALAEQQDAPGSTAVLAYVAGYEAMSAIGTSMGEKHYAGGFHATGTLGTLGAAVASAKVLGLGTEETTMALAIACSGAAGLRSNVGTDTKPLHAAQAAACGVRAAELAARGFTGSPDALDGSHGLISVMGGVVDTVASDVRQLGDTWYLRAAPPTVKLYPSCGMTHSAISCALEIRQHYPELARRPERIVVRVPPQSAWPLKYHDPRTGLEAKFCLEYVIAVALLDGAVGIRHFRDESVYREAVRGLMGKVALVNDSSYEQIVTRHEGYPMSMELYGAAGSASKEVLHGPGSSRNPATMDQLFAKFGESVAWPARGDSAQDLWQQLLALPGAATVRSCVRTAVAQERQPIG